MGSSMSNPVIIIGAGIAGLSAGSYLQMNGYTTRKDCALGTHPFAQYFIRFSGQVHQYAPGSVRLCEIILGLYPQSSAGPRIPYDLDKKI